MGRRQLSAVEKGQLRGILERCGPDEVVTLVAGWVAFVYEPAARAEDEGPVQSLLESGPLRR
jgi:hypothetical protein